MMTFSELTNQIHLINDLILSDTVCADENIEEASNFSSHLLSTKNWFSRISWSNKKRFVLALLEDVCSAWTLSLLLKSLWNCRPKDAVLSVCEKRMWSSYDQVPMDHNRTALPTTILAQVMKSDRLWFLGLNPEAQAMVLSELLIVSGGPVMWAVLRRAQTLYERYRDDQLLNLQECIVVNEQHLERSSHTEKPPAAKKTPTPRKPTTISEKASTSAVDQTAEHDGAHKELEANLAAWHATVKALKDSLKLEEFEMRFNDGTTRKIWKVNRPKPEVIETVDFLQLLPSSVAKRILFYLPLNQLGEYARVNRYWAFLVDEFRAEVTTRQKIQADFERLHENMLRHDVSLDFIEQLGAGKLSSQGNASVALSLRPKALTSVKASEKSGGAYSMRHFISEKLNKTGLESHVPLRNVAELSKRLDQRGAADENLWSWCENILKRAAKNVKPDHQEGVLTLGNIHFPCPLMKQCLEVPLNPPLYKDPAVTAPSKLRRNISSAAVLLPPREQNAKRYSLWSRDLSGLYPVYKIPSYQYPI